MSVNTKQTSDELHEEFQSALEELENAKQTMLAARGAPGRITTPEKLAAFGDAEIAFEKAAARCSQVAQRMAAL